jgi:hypothetical protein
VAEVAGTRPSGRARRVGGLTVALIVPFVLIGCTDGSESLSDDAFTPPPSASASTEAGPGSRLDLRAADFVLTAGPDTPGFTSEPRSEDDYRDASKDDLARCLGIPATDLEDTTTDTAYGPRLTDTTTRLSIASVASIVPAGTFDEANLVRNPRLPRCFAESYLAQHRARISSMEIVSAGVGPELPGVVSSISMVFRVKAVDQSAEFHYDTYYVGKNRVGTVIHVLGYLPPDQSRVALAIAQVAGKIDRQG